MATLQALAGQWQFDAFKKRLQQAKVIGSLDLKVW